MKSKMELRDYYILGARFRLINHMLCESINDLRGKATKSEIHKIDSVLQKLRSAKWFFEDEMFDENFPSDCDCQSVFEGSFEGLPTNETDREVRKLAMCESDSLSIHIEQQSSGCGNRGVLASRYRSIPSELREHTVSKEQQRSV